MKKKGKDSMRTDSSKLPKLIPLAITAFILLMGIALVLFVQFLFVRPPDVDVVESIYRENQDIDIKVDKQKLQSLIEPHEARPEVDMPSYKNKNPFKPD